MAAELRWIAVFIGGRSVRVFTSLDVVCEYESICPVARWSLKQLQVLFTIPHSFLAEA